MLVFVGKTRGILDQQLRFTLMNKINIIISLIIKLKTDGCSVKRQKQASHAGFEQVTKRVRRVAKWKVTLSK